MIKLSKGTKIGDSTVLGLEVVQAQLQQLPKRLGKAVVRRGLLAGAAVIREEARALAPTKGVNKYSTGLLRKSIVARTSGKFIAKGVDRQEYYAYVSIKKGKAGGKNPRRYAHLVEFGTRPHAVGKGSMLPTTRSKKPKEQKGAMHPGTRPQPFMRPAFDRKKFAALSAIREVTLRELDKELAGLALGLKRISA